MKNNLLPFIFILSLISSLGNAADYETSISLPAGIELGLPVSGMIQAVNVKTGQRISKGDVILALDPAPFEVAKTHAQASVTVFKTMLKESQRDLEHHKELYDRTVLSTVDLENVEMREIKDRAHLADARAQLAAAEYNLGYSKLKSPFDAIVLSVHSSAGQYLNNTVQSHALVSLARQGHYQARFYVAAEELAKLKIDQAVSVKVTGENYPARVSSIEYQSDTESKAESPLFSVVVEFSAQDKQLTIGGKATVHIE